MLSRKEDGPRECSWNDSKSTYYIMWVSQVVPVVKNPPVNAGDSRDGKFDPWVQGVSELDPVEQLTTQCMLSTLVMSDSLGPPWTVALQAPLSVGFSRQKYWSGLPCPPARDLPDPGIELTSLLSFALGFFTTSATWGKPFSCASPPRDLVIPWYTGELSRESLG